MRLIAEGLVCPQNESHCQKERANKKSSHREILTRKELQLWRECLDRHSADEISGVIRFTKLGIDIRDA